MQKALATSNLSKSNVNVHYMISTILKYTVLCSDIQCYILRDVDDDPIDLYR